MARLEKAYASLLSMFLCFVSASPAAAALYVCETKHAYNLEDGELRRDRESGELLTWPTVTFDDVSGTLRYGHEATAGSIGKTWFEEKLTVTAKGSPQGSASGHYMHNGTIFSAIVIHAWDNPPSFIFLKGGNSAALTGTCRTFGN